MSLIKSVDVPKHMADRLRSRRIAARLSGGASKQPAVPAGKALTVPPIAAPIVTNDTPELLGPATL
jgi:hypothetical protein